MSKIKNYYMENFHPIFSEREYLFDDILAQEDEYLENENYMEDPSTGNIIIKPIKAAKIEVNHGKSTNIRKSNSQEYISNKYTENFRSGL